MKGKGFQQLRDMIRDGLINQTHVRIDVPSLERVYYIQHNEKEKLCLYDFSAGEFNELNIEEILNDREWETFS